MDQNLYGSVKSGSTHTNLRWGIPFGNREIGLDDFPVQSVPVTMNCTAFAASYRAIRLALSKREVCSPFGTESGAPPLSPPPPTPTLPPPSLPLGALEPPKTDGLEPCWESAAWDAIEEFGRGAKLSVTDPDCINGGLNW